MIELISATDTRLNLVSSEVTKTELGSAAIQSLIDDMLELASGERDKENPQKATMVGLAAPQVGVLKRIIVVDVVADPGVPNFVPELIAVINPRVVEVSENEVLGREGCYSTDNFCGAVFRPDSVVIGGLSRFGEELRIISQNPFQARIFQHEIDHLNGVRFPDRVRQAEHLHLVDKDTEFDEYRKTWETWSKLARFSDWIRLKQGNS